MHRSDLRYFYLLIPFALALAACGRSPQEKEALYLKRGADFVAKHDYARALLEFRNAAAVMPRDAEPYYQLGAAYLDTGKETLAIESFRRALQLNPKHTASQLRIAELMVMTGDKERWKAHRSSCELLFRNRLATGTPPKFSLFPSGGSAAQALLSEG